MPYSSVHVTLGLFPSWALFLSSMFFFLDGVGHIMDLAGINFNGSG